MSVTVHHGDCLDVLRGMAEASVDSVATDPPYHLTSGKKGGTGPASLNLNSPVGRSRVTTGFMGKAWDGGDVAMRPETWAEVYRVMKPGAHLVAFGGTRTYHRLVCAIEDAGFEVRDQLAWCFGTGFPKSHNLPGGLGTALKPAWEPIVLARKPLACPTVAAQVLETGTGALNVDGCRVEAAADYHELKVTQGGHHRHDVGLTEKTRHAPFTPAAGRWPPNLLHDGSPEVLEAFGRFGPKGGGGKLRLTTCNEGRADESQYRIKPPEGTIRDHGDGFGTAARFFPALGFGEEELWFMYSAKASKADRCGSRHPTVKPVALMRWLCRLVTPPSGVVLDPFAGSGTTGEAALREGFSAVLIEREAEYHADILARLARYRDEAPLPLEVLSIVPEIGVGS